MKISLSFENPRLRLGAERLLAALKAVGAHAEIQVADAVPRPGDVLIAVRGESAAVAEMEEKELLLYHAGLPEGEAYQLETAAGSGVAVVGGSETGALYGCLELAERIRRV